MPKTSPFGKINQALNRRQQRRSKVQVSDSDRDLAERREAERMARERKRRLKMLGLSDE